MKGFSNFGKAVIVVLVFLLSIFIYQACIPGTQNQKEKSNPLETLLSLIKSSVDSYYKLTGTVYDSSLPLSKAILEIENTEEDISSQKNIKASKAKQNLVVEADANGKFTISLKGMSGSYRVFVKSSDGFLRGEFLIKVVSENEAPKITLLKSSTFSASFEEKEDVTVVYGELDFSKSRPFYLVSDGGNGQALLSILSLFNAESYDIFVNSTNKVSETTYSRKIENEKPKSSREVTTSTSEKFTDLRFTVTGLNNGQDYFFAIRGKDKNGNYSHLSNWAKATPAINKNASLYDEADNSCAGLDYIEFPTNNSKGFVITQGNLGYPSVNSCSLSEDSTLMCVTHNFFSNSDGSEYDNGYDFDNGNDNDVLSPFTKSSVFLIFNEHNKGSAYEEAKGYCLTGGRVVCLKKDITEEVMCILHLSSVSVSLNQTIFKGNLIGVSGSSGRKSDKTCKDKTYPEHIHIHMFNTAKSDSFADGSTLPFPKSLPLRVQRDNREQCLYGYKLDYKFLYNSKGAGNSLTSINPKVETCGSVVTNSSSYTKSDAITVSWKKECITGNVKISVKKKSSTATTPDNSTYFVLTDSIANTGSFTLNSIATSVSIGNDWVAYVKSVNDTTNVFFSSTFEIKESPVPTCNSPVFTPNSGSYVSSQNVSISSSNCPTIKYITSVTEPTDPTCSTGTTFASSFAVSTNTNVKAIACNASYNPSLITSVSYVFTPQYSVGGTVSGLTGSVTLRNNGANDKVITTNASYSFASINNGTSYNITVSSQPSGQTCTVTNGSGTVSSADVTNVNVTCSTIVTYSVGGTVSGLAGSLTLRNNGANDKVITTDTSYSFTGLTNGSGYNVTIYSQPSGQTCTITNNFGTVSSANVTNIAVSCPVATCSGCDITVIQGLPLTVGPITNGATVFFGSLAVGSSKTFNFGVGNPGSGTTTMTNSPVVVLSNTTDFTISMYPVNPLGSSTEQMKIVFNPQSSGTKSSTVSIPNNTPSNNPFTFTVTGN